MTTPPPSHSESQLHKIGDVAEHLGMTTRTLRFYEEQGIITPHRTDKGSRLYSEEDIARLTVVQHLVHLNVPLQMIRKLATARPLSTTGDESSHKVFSLLSDLKNQMEIKKKETEYAIQHIVSAMELVEKCFGCRLQPTYRVCDQCRIAEGLDDSDMFHLIWDQAQSTQ